MLILGGIIFFSNYNSAKAVSCGDFQPGTCRPSCLSGETQIPDSSVSPVCSPINQVCCAPAPTASTTGTASTTPSSGQTNSTTQQNPASSSPSSPGLPVPAAASPWQASSAPASAPAASNYAVPASTSSNYNGGILLPQMGLPGASIQDIIGNLLVWLLGIVGVIAIISFIISGIQYFAAAGDETRMETAKKTMTYSIIGIIVVLASYVIIQAINFALQARSFF